MESDPLRDWRRWAASERESLDDEADTAFQALFSAVPAQSPAAGFSDRVVEAVARASARQKRLFKAAAAVGIVCGAALTLVLLMQLPRLLGAAFDVLISGIVSMTIALGRGLDVWTVLVQIARAIGSVVVAPQGTYGLIVLGLVALGALYALHRMLELEKRSSL